MQLIRKQVKKGETFVTCSQSLSNIYKSKHGLEFDFIRNGVDVEKYSCLKKKDKLKIKKNLGLPLDKIIMAYSGQFIDRKNQRFAIEGVLNSRYKDDIYMVLMGDGANYNKLVAQYGKRKNLLFTGNINNVNEYLQASDLYVSASKSEGMPNGVLEAMATGLPVLLSDIPQHMEIIEINNKCGLSFKLDNQADFINKLDDIMGLDFEEMGRVSSTIVVNELSAKGMSKKYQKLYLKLIEG
jgi:glycosyltransferase involved in cell wall biosynthesis